MIDDATTTDDLLEELGHARRYAEEKLGHAFVAKHLIQECASIYEKIDDLEKKVLKDIQDDDDPYGSEMHAYRNRFDTTRDDNVIVDPAAADNIRDHIDVFLKRVDDLFVQIN